MPTAISGLPGLIQQPPTAAVLAAAQSQAAALNYGKLMTGTGMPTVSSSSGGGPQPIPTALSSFRYAPYPIPNASAISASQAVQQAAALAAQQQVQPNPQTSNAQPSGVPGTPVTQSQAAGQAAAAAAQLNALAGATSLPAAVSLGALAASSQALQTFAQSGVNAAVIPSVTAGGGLAAPGLANSAPAAAAAATTGAPNPMAAAAAAAAVANPYSGYSLTNVDMSSFQGVDWSSIYGMGMYV